MIDAARPRRDQLVLRFAVASLVAFLVIGVVVTVALAKAVRSDAEDNARSDAKYIVDSVLTPGFKNVPVAHPLRGANLAKVDALVSSRILHDHRIVRVKVWAADGTVLYSDDQSLIGKQFTDEQDGFAEVMQGHVETEITDLTDAENQQERPLADKLFQTYVPLRRAPGEEPIAIAEIYQDYSAIQSQIDVVVKTLIIVLTCGLAILYGLLLPIAARASSRLRRQRDQLSDQAATLSELLSREQETVAELRKLNEMQTDFVSAASHELRTPLTSVIGYLATLRRPGMRDDVDATEEFLGAAERAATRLSHLVTNLLSASKVEDGSRPLSVSVVRVDDLLTAVLDELPDGADRVRVELKELPSVRTDRQRLHEIMRNLIENALKYSEDTEPVDVDFEQSSDELIIHVRDRGVGIDPADQPAIFERFHQADQSSTRRHGGLGLGLHLSRTLVEEIGGSIAVRSDVGRGSTFTVRVPIGTPAIEDERVNTRPSPRGSSAPPPPSLCELGCPSSGVARSPSHAILVRTM